VTSADDNCGVTFPGVCTAVSLGAAAVIRERQTEEARERRREREREGERKRVRDREIERERANECV